MFSLFDTHTQKKTQVHTTVEFFLNFCSSNLTRDQGEYCEKRTPTHEYRKD